MPEPVLQGGNPTNGKALYSTCSACHGADASGMEAVGSGPLRYSSDWYLLVSLEKFKAGIRGSAPGDQTGALMRPMANLLADEQAMKDVISYIMTLRK
jgi:cytochrome c553